MQRLRTRSQFQAVLAGRVAAKTAHFALHVLPLPAAQLEVQGAWIGALVPKRWAKRASTRNAIRRQVYRIGADAEPLLAARACVVRLRAAFDRAYFHSPSSNMLKKTVYSELEQLFARLEPPPAEAQS